jgi:hypothetical protein
LLSLCKNLAMPQHFLKMGFQIIESGLALVRAEDIDA